MAKRSQRHLRYMDSRDEDGSVVSIQSAARKRDRGQWRTPTAERPSIHYMTEAQYHYADGIDKHTLTFGIGPAGTGKSFVPAAKAALALLAGEVEKIIVTRPMVGGDEEEMGALPGTLLEKAAPWFAPIRAILEKFLGNGAVECHLKNGNIEFLPLQYMRGVTMHDAFVIMDESQNATKKQLELFLTRIGEHCTVAVTGDEDQCDLKGPNGLKDAIKRLKGVDNIFIYRFETSDIVRSKLCRDIVARYHPSKSRSRSDEAEEG